MDNKVYVLTYGSNDTDDVLYVECLGVFSTMEKAKAAMKRNIDEDIADGYDDESGCWSYSKNYVKFSSDLNDKAYRISIKDYE